MATIYDSTAAADIPDAAHGFVFAYNDGLYSQVAKVQARFPDARVITISAIGQASADVVDVEPGCVWPVSSAVAYVQRERQAGRNPTVYCGRANWPTVIQAFAQAGMAQPHYWVAHYTNSPHLCSSTCYPSSVGSLTAVATQYGGDLPGHFDVTFTNGSWPDDIHAAGSGIQLDPVDAGVALTAIPIAAPTVQEDDDMQLIQGDTRGIALIGPGYFRDLTNNEEVAVATKLFGDPKIKDDRGYDVAKALALGGRPDDVQLAAIEREDAK